MPLFPGKSCSYEKLRRTPNRYVVSDIRFANVDVQKTNWTLRWQGGMIMYDFITEVQ